MSSGERKLEVIPGQVVSDAVGPTELTKEKEREKRTEHRTLGKTYSTLGDKKGA